MTPDSSPAPQPDGDPSMEEILASIRKILNEDDHPLDPGVPAGGTVPDEVLVLDETMMVAPAEPVRTPALEAKPVAPPQSVLEPARPEPIRLEPIQPEPALPPRIAPPSEPPGSALMAPESAGSGLLAPESAAAAASSLGSLVRTLSAGRGTQVYSGGPTLEDMVRGEMRPLVKAWLDAHLGQLVEATVRAEVRDQLKGWLDQHLPIMVERLVRAEIERVVGRGMP